MRELTVRPGWLLLLTLAIVLAGGACAADPDPGPSSPPRGFEPRTEVFLRVAYGSVVPPKSQPVLVLDRSPWLQVRRTACGLEVPVPSDARTGSAARAVTTAP